VLAGHGTHEEESGEAETRPATQAWTHDSAHTHTRIKIAALSIETGEFFEHRVPMLMCYSHAANTIKHAQQMLFASSKLCGVNQTDIVTDGNDVAVYSRAAFSLDSAMSLEFNSVMQNIEIGLVIYHTRVGVVAFNLAENAADFDPDENVEDLRELVVFEMVLEYETYTP
jgi:hypothetical protein